MALGSAISQAVHERATDGEPPHRPHRLQPYPTPRTAALPATLPNSRTACNPNPNPT